MKKFQKCIYMIMLFVTFVIVSPFMVVKIWNSSDLKTVAIKKIEEFEEAQMEDEPEIVVIPIEANPTAVMESETEPPVSNEITAETDVTEPTSATEPETQPQTELETEPTVQPATFAPASVQKAKSAKFVTSDVSYFDDALFIGDSRTEDIKLYGNLTGADFFCSVGLSNYKVNTVTVDGMLLSEYLANKQYGKIYIMLGLNEIGDSIDYTTGMYKSLVEQIQQVQPSALIFLEANLHVTNWYSQQNPSQSNERLDTYNQKIAELANNTNIFYIDINEIFDDENGALPADYTGDGIHPYAKYYTDWSEWLCKKTIR